MIALVDKAVQEHTKAASKVIFDAGPESAIEIVFPSGPVFFEM